MKIKFEELTNEPTDVSCGDARARAFVYSLISNDACVDFTYPVKFRDVIPHAVFDAMPFERAREPRVLPFVEWVKLREGDVWWEVSCSDKQVAWWDERETWRWANGIYVGLDWRLVNATFTEVIE